MAGYGNSMRQLNRVRERKRRFVVWNPADYAVFSPSQLNPTAWYAADLSPKTTDGAASFVATSSQYLSNASLISAISPLTTSFWVFMPTLTTQYGAWQALGNCYCNIQGSAGNGKVRCNFGSSSIQTSSTFTTSTWTHVVVTYDGATCNLYLNGVKDGGSGSIANNPMTGTTFIGHDTGITYFNGQMDAFKVYSRVWSQTEVTADYNSGNGVPANPTALAAAGISTTSLVACYDFNGPGANLVLDYSGNGNNLTNTNTVTGTAGHVTSSILLSGDTVTTLGDLSGNGNTRSQPTFANRRIYITNAVGSLPCLRSTAASQQYDSATFTLNQPCSFWTVGTLKDAANEKFMSGPGVTSWIGRQSGAWQMNGGSGGIGSVAADTNPHAWAGVFNGAISSLTVDGQTPSTGTTTNNPGGVQVGAGNGPGSYASYDEYETVVCASPLTESQIAQLRTYAQQRGWGNP